MRTSLSSFYELYTPYDTCSTPQRDTCHMASTWLPQGCRAGVDTEHRTYFCGLGASQARSLDGIGPDRARVCPQHTSGQCSRRRPATLQMPRWRGVIFAHLGALHGVGVDTGSIPYQNVKQTIREGSRGPIGAGGARVCLQHPPNRSSTRRPVPMVVGHSR